MTKKRRDVKKIDKKEHDTLHETGQKGHYERSEEVDEYIHIVSKDEYDEDTRSLDNNENEEVNSVFHTDYEE